MSSKYEEVRRKLEQVTGMTGDNITQSFLPSSVNSTPNRREAFNRQSPTLMNELFASEDSQTMMGQQSIRDTHNSIQSAMDTINPASLSPPPMDSMDIPDENSFDVRTSGMTQHPAAMLCDLPCQPKVQRPWMNSTRDILITQLLTHTLWTQMMISIILSNILTPLEQIKHSLMNGSLLLPTPSLLTMIISLVAPSTTPSSMISFTKTKSHNLRPKFSLRIRLLRRLLACSPNLARPLMDATLKTMRLDSNQQLVRDCMNGADVKDFSHGGESSRFESLMTLFWAVKVIIREMEKVQTSIYSKPDAGMNVEGSDGGKVESLFELRKFCKVYGGKSFKGDEESWDGYPHGTWSMALEDEQSSSS